MFLLGIITGLESSRGNTSPKEVIETNDFFRNMLTLSIFGRIRHQNMQFFFLVSFRVDETLVWNTALAAPLPPLPALPSNHVSSTAARTPTSTRAGGQDDVSSNKLPQIIYAYIIYTYIIYNIYIYEITDVFA